MIDFSDFQKVDIRTGTILEAELNPKAHQPAFVMRIDFGEWGVKTSSARLTENYRADNLVGKQIIAVVNFPSKRIAGVKSEVFRSYPIFALPTIKHIDANSLFRTGF